MVMNEIPYKVGMPTYPYQGTSPIFSIQVSRLYYMNIGMDIQEMLPYQTKINNKKESLTPELGYKQSPKAIQILSQMN